jgi:hypothetical protein
MSAVLSNDEKAARSATKRDDEPGVLAVPRRLSSVQIREGQTQHNRFNRIRTPLRRCGYKSNLISPRLCVPAAADPPDAALRLLQ